MAWTLDYPENEHDTRLLMGDPVAQSYEWIKRYAMSLGSGGCYDDCGTCEECLENGPVTTEELIDHGMSWVNGKSRYGGEYLSKGGALEGISTDPMFWEKLAILKGIDIPADMRENFFSCSC